MNTFASHKVFMSISDASRNIIQGSKLAGSGSSGLHYTALQAAAPLNICREPKDYLFDIHNTFMKLMKMQLDKIFISTPAIQSMKSKWSTSYYWPLGNKKGNDL